MKSIVKTFNDYRILRQGGKVDFDKAYGAQCVDLIRDWRGYAALPQITKYGHAINLWNSGLGEGWKRVTNSVFFKPKVGDIIFFNFGEYGHVAIAGQSSYTWIEILEQNGGSGNGDGEGNNAIRLRKSSYNGCLGWFTPIK